MATRNGSQGELTAGLLLIGAAALGIVFANTGLAPFYDLLRGMPVAVRIGDFSIDKPLLLWINDGLMAVFFFVVGLEIKRELLIDQLSTPRRAALPVACALGGMAIPALIYVYFNDADPTTLRGWAIPAATDIAFALGILALVGRSVPISVKVLLTAIAIIDDLGAIVIIAVYYTADLSTTALLVWGVGVAALAVLNRLRVTHMAPYLVVAAITWAALVKSGVHATLAGVVNAFFVPIVAKDRDETPMLIRLEEDLKPLVGFFIVPVFGFCNAGVSFAGLTWASFLAPVTLGIAAGLFIGKQIGIFVPLWVGVRLKLVPMPEGATWLQLYGMALLCGVGFTMSLFIGGLAFTDGTFDAAVRLGVLTGSLVSAVVGLAVLRSAAGTNSVSRGAASA
ncbi:MAG: Na+/H+ antiporter NhaA [Alphaproteobacteria bacterium]|nr:Na+/H+ antiporter NhaA [Alphaproteobacteria bacterium]